MAISQQLSPLPSPWHLVKLALAARAEGTNSEAEHAEDWARSGAQRRPLPSPCLLCGPDEGSSSLLSP